METNSPPWLITLLAAACGVAAATLWYVQPIAGLVGTAVGLPQEQFGLILTVSQIGYSTGLFLVVPAGDLIENRRLILALLVVSALALLAFALSSDPLSTFVAAWLIGIAGVAVQILLPYAAHLTPQAMHGRVIGKLMSGLMLGVVLARPISSLLTQFFSSWHVVFFLGCGSMVILAFVLARALPQRRPTSDVCYVDLLASMSMLLRTTPILRRRALYQAALFGAFSLFWTAVPLFLAGPTFNLSQDDIAIVALAGIAGVAAGPIAGRIVDRGRGQSLTACALLLAAAAFLIARIGIPGTPLSIVALVIAAIVLDFGATANAIVSQRMIFSLRPELRSCLNGVYMTTLFIGGAIGSAVGGWSYAQGGWSLTSWIGLALPLAALLYFLTEGPETLRIR